MDAGLNQLETPARNTALSVYRGVLRSLSGDELSARALSGLTLHEPITLLGLGKAAHAMAAGAVSALGTLSYTGLVVGKSESPGLSGLSPLLERRIASHPEPDTRSLAAGEALLARAAAAPPDGTMLVLLSGGASALAAVPALGVTLSDKVRTTRAVSAAGASIGELNTVRRHLSRIKGGRLALARTGPLSALVLSDVVGDDLATIGGGPVSGDPSTAQDALEILRARAVSPPPAVLARLERAARGQEVPPPRPGDPRLAGVEVRVLAGPSDLAQAARQALEARGVHVVASELVTDSVPVLAARLVASAHHLALAASAGQPLALVLAGEPTIVLPESRGRGGRAQHCALLAAQLLARQSMPAGSDVAILCGATDGSDGPTTDAGGLVDPASAARISGAGVDLSARLAAFDSGPALAASGDLLSTGPTGTNLADLYLVVACCSM